MNIVAKLLLVDMVNVMEGPTKSFANVTLVGWEKIVKQKVILRYQKNYVKNNESLDNINLIVYIFLYYLKIVVDFSYLPTQYN